MPLYEFRCRRCEAQFELLVRSGSEPACPSCTATDLERILSMFAVSSEATRASNLSAARKAGAKEAKDRKQAEIEAIQNHSH
jgi:putative FmdB family regulatory protein